jgi:chorismate mutase
VGDIALEWLKEVKLETGLPVAVEVASPRHIEASLRAGIDVLWIGARTAGNPFSMEEIASALGGVDIPVMVKNPLIPDPALWLGALERLKRTGVKRLAAIHRGFYPYVHTPYRHDPMWEIPIELKRQCPELPIICDPSHISGDPSLIAGIAQQALDLAMDGLMIEVHPDPAKALSDSGQQILPEELEAILQSLRIPRAQTPDDSMAWMLTLRREIDQLDHEMIRILQRRMAVVGKIGAYKKEQGISLLQLRRWIEILEDRTRNAEKAGLNKDFVKTLLQIIHKEALRIQAKGEQGEKETD